MSDEEIEKLLFDAVDKMPPAIRDAARDWLHKRMAAHKAVDEMIAEGTTRVVKH